MKEVPVTFKVKEKQVVGMLHLPKRKNAPIIIMCHGWSGTKTGPLGFLFVKAAREFSKNGFAVVRFDFRGSGDSQGKWEDQTTTTMLQDLDAVINQISKIPEINKDKIGIVGHSQGGRIALLKAAFDKRIKCLVGWAARTDLTYFWGQGWIDDAKLRVRVYDDYKVTRKYVKDDLRYNVAKAIPKIKVPICVIHGDMDYGVQLAEAYRIFKLAHKPKKLIVVKGTDHYFSGEKNQKDVIKITLNWFKRWLR